MKIQQIQTILGVTADGIWGPKTQAALEELLHPSTTGAGEVDERSETNIATLHPRVRAFARQLIKDAAANDIEIKVISGTRSYAEQDALFAKHPKVTNARGGFSNHNFGIAFDIGVFKSGKYIPESSAYATVGQLGMNLGLEWGGAWQSFRDEPHFQLRPAWAKGWSEGNMLAELRQRKDTGKDTFA